MARVDRPALRRWVEQVCDTVEATPMPDDVRDLVQAAGLPEAEWPAVWIAAGLATQMADPLRDAPEAFVVSHRGGYVTPRTTSSTRR